MNGIYGYFDNKNNYYVYIGNSISLIEKRIKKYRESIGDMGAKYG